MFYREERERDFDRVKEMRARIIQIGVLAMVMDLVSGTNTCSPVSQTNGKSVHVFIFLYFHVFKLSTILSHVFHVGTDRPGSDYAQYANVANVSKCSELCCDDCSFVKATFTFRKHPRTLVRVRYFVLLSEECKCISRTKYVTWNYQWYREE